MVHLVDPMIDRHPITPLSMGLTCLFLCLDPALASAQEEFSRARKHELFAVAQHFLGDGATDNGSGVKISFHDMTGGGFGIGYNVTDHFNYNLELLFGGTETKFELGATSLEEDTTVIGFNFNFEYNLLKSRMTPVISGGFGLLDFSLSGKIGDLEIRETDLSYGFGGGLRWDINDKFFMKLVYRTRWTELRDFSDMHRFDTYNLYFGFTF